MRKLTPILLVYSLRPHLIHGREAQADRPARWTCACRSPGASRPPRESTANPARRLAREPQQQTARGAISASREGRSPGSSPPGVPQPSAGWPCFRDVLRAGPGEVADAATRWPRSRICTPSRLRWSMWTQTGEDPGWASKISRRAAIKASSAVFGRARWRVSWPPAWSSESGTASSNRSFGFWSSLVETRALIRSGVSPFRNRPHCW